MCNPEFKPQYHQNREEARDVVQLVEYLPFKHKAPEFKHQYQRGEKSTDWVYEKQKHSTFEKTKNNKI
jgi:hypothetical protein